MPMTISEKILAAHADRSEVHAGELVFARLDLMLGHDLTAPLAIEEFRKMAERVNDPNRVVLVNDHNAPAKDVYSAQLQKVMRDFAREQGIKNYYEVGRSGICHALLPEQGLVLPGDLVVGADSHTCTYGALGAFATGMGSTDVAAAWALGETWFRVPDSLRIVLQGQPAPWVGGKDIILHIIGQIGVEGALYQSMEFTGQAIPSLSMADRLTMCNMAVEAGAKTGLVEPDDVTLQYVAGRASRPYTVYRSDPDAHYTQTLELDISTLEPQVAFPFLPSNVRPISQVGDVEIDQVVVGSCTNGTLKDLREAAEVLRGRQVHPRVRMIILPATQTIFKAAAEEGLLSIFVESGASVSTPTCGPCIGGHMGILAAGERAVATTNRNFVGRMGHVKSEVYLANPAVAAASAIVGRIAGPEDVLGKRSD